MFEKSSLCAYLAVASSSALASAGLVVFSGGAVSAGGLCGDGGFIRGDIGTWCDENIEGPITTPVVQGAALTVTTAAGTVVGGALGNPVAGAYVGERVGETINERAAGKSPPIGRPANHGTNGKPAKTVTFVFSNRAKYIVEVRMFSQSRKVIWPGAKAAFDISDRRPHKIKIRCNVGEKICFGAYYSESGEEYWGVGKHGREACEDCCGICGGPSVSGVLKE